MAENQPGVAQQALSLMHGVSALDIPEDQRAETYALLEKIAPNMRSVPSRKNGEGELRLGNGSPHADNPDQEDAARVMSYRRNALLELKDSEYFNRKIQLGQISPNQLEQAMMGRGSIGDIDSGIFQSTPKNAQYGAGMINPFMIGANADFDGNALGDMLESTNGGKALIPPAPIPGFPLDELVNLPRFIMADVAPFAFVNEAQYKPTKLRLPYPKILFELGPEDNRHMVVVTQHGDYGYDFRTEYLHTDKDTPFEIGAMSHVDLGHGDILEINQMVYQTDPAVAEWTLMAIIGFIAEFSVGNTIIGTQARDPNRVIPQPGTTRKYRIVRVVMGVTKVCKPWQGGTHASPREHERMGHWRRVKGEPRWFPAVTVNKGVIGRVMKEYHVNHRNKPSPAIQGPEA
jgi:hypothetical protein